MTKREMFTEIRKVVVDNADMVAFIDHELELLDKKRTSKKPNKKQIENNLLREEILKTLVEIGDRMTITELIQACPALEGFANQKVSALLAPMVKEGKVKRIVEKKVTYFQIETE